MFLTRLLEENQLEEAAAILRGDGLLVFPTETVYGLGANALSDRAAARIFEAKGRPQDNPLIVHIAGLDELDRVAIGVNRLAQVLMESLMPGPLTVILPRAPGLAASVSAGKDTVGVRIPGLALARRLIKAAGVPVAAPSANRSGRPSPTSFAMARAEMEGRVEGILDGPDAVLGLESTIVWPQDERRLHLLRPGGVSLESIRASLDRAGLTGIEILKASRGTETPAAPGTRYRHYSPQAQVRLFADAAELRVLLAGPDALAAAGQGGGISLLGAELCPDCPRGQAPAAYRSTFAGLEDYAHHLYRELVAADHRLSPLVLAWLPPAAGLGLALRDRLERAAGKLGH